MRGPAASQVGVTSRLAEVASSAARSIGAEHCQPCSFAPLSVIPCSDNSRALRYRPHIGYRPHHMRQKGMSWWALLGYCQKL